MLNDYFEWNEMQKRYSLLELFRLLSFQGRDTKLDRGLPKNQYTEIIIFCELM
jgi:hypothetical protein